MNRFFEKEKDFSFAYSGSEEKKFYALTCKRSKYSSSYSHSPQPH